MEHQLNLDDFSFRVHQCESDYAVTNELSSRLKGTNVEIVGRTSPVYRYCGHLYYLGFRIIPIFRSLLLQLNHHFQVDKVLPFVESRLAPSVFDPIISQMHWKRGDKLVDVAQHAEYPFYHIHRVDMEEGVMVAHLVLTQGDKEDAQELWSSGVHVDINRLPHEYTLSGFRLRLVIGDHVRVIAGPHKMTCGMVIALVPDEGYVCIIPYGGVSELVSYCACNLSDPY